ncbi:uncharacterized protein LOC103927438 isoform X3 [Pyrus x bretschneideri]|uniref:uncharacterized protein LOC103927438 isoform X3 n=1 Tax=Pyrus x bretschneideri TaxID=225117 RepID=UPI00202F90E9|nr:uncharacterized protein LOC103927438 isoform X3 [Pyrus x bretschneideri]
MLSVGKYFHPDNMSSAEKLKLELAKVRDEFKMSESDCGSARVQVAQLTTKIKHLQFFTAHFIPLRSNCRCLPSSISVGWDIFFRS